MVNVLLKYLILFFDVAVVYMHIAVLPISQSLAEVEAVWTTAFFCSVMFYFFHQS